MKKLVPLIAVTAFALSGAVLAGTDGNNESQTPGDAQSSAEVKKPEGGFVLLQRNIYVPIDAEGKIASNQWLVIEKQGFVTADEVEAVARDAANDVQSNGPKDDDDASGAQAKPKRDDATPSPRSIPSPTRHLPIGEGPMTRS
jgi:hypothetical protein